VIRVTRFQFLIFNVINIRIWRHKSSISGSCPPPTSRTGTRCRSPLAGGLRRVSTVKHQPWYAKANSYGGLLHAAFLFPRERDRSGTTSPTLSFRSREGDQ
jgi:hypothetical protein